jgi:hypothetical protein
MTRLNDLLQEISAAKDGGPLRDALTGRVEFAVIGPMPLSRMTNLGDTGVTTTFPTGEVRFELRDVSAVPLQIAAVTAATAADGSGIVAIELAPMTMSGQYRLFAVEQPKIDIDTGGGLLPLATMTEPADQTSITPEQFEQLKQARLQRAQLKTTANGQKLLRSYSQHNDAYNTAFQTNNALRVYWQAQGATQAMADDTSKAIAGSGSVINSNSVAYGPQKVSYNDNAFQQQTYLVAALAFTNPEASLAASTFASQINNATGNTQVNTVEMTSSGVYSAINSVSSTLGEQTSDSNPLLLHDSLIRVARNEHTDTHMQLLRKSGYKMSDRHVRTMQEIYAESVRQAEPANQAGLWSGEMAAALPASRFEFSLTEHAGGIIAVTMTKRSMAVPDLKIDNTAWRGAAGNLAKKRLDNAHFMSSLLAARIIDFVDRAVIEGVTRFAGTAR